MSKLIVSDLDGTLLVNKQLPKETAEILKKAQEKGFIIALASGRSFNSILKIASDFQFENYPNYIIEADGQKVTSLKTKESFEFAKVPYSIVLKTLNYAMDNNLFMSINFGDNHYRYAPYLVSDPNRRTMGINLEKRCLIDIVDVPKIGIYDINEFNADKVSSDLKVLLGDKVTVYKTNNHFIEITALGINKVNCVDWIQKHLGLADQDIYVFGDGENDIEMLKRYPNSYAVDNALDQVKEVANYHIDSNIDEGVKNEIARLLKENRHD